MKKLISRINKRVQLLERRQRVGWEGDSWENLLVKGAGRDVFSGRPTRKQCCWVGRNMGDPKEKESRSDSMS